MPARFRPHAALFLAMTPLAACTVGPNYHAPKTQIAPQWTSAATAGEVDAGSWWKEFNDPLLNALVDEMLAGSPTLKEAQARLAEARASRDAVRGGTLPQVQASGSYNENELSKNGELPLGAIPGFARDFGLFDLGFDASWEIDLWGRGRRQIEAATAREEQAQMSAQGMRLQLVAELARAYVDLRLAQQETGLAKETLDTRRALADLTAQRAGAGEDSQVELAHGASDFSNAEAALANSQAAERGAALRVVALVGGRLDTLLPRLTDAAPIPAPPSAVAAGLPSELLRRRPDIRSAERDLAAATADVGIATADLFPRLRLGLSVGQQARALGDLFSGDSTRLQAGPGLSWPVFSGGSVKAQIRAADARVDQAAARYDAAVISALTDSETAINRFDRSLAASAASERAFSRDSAGFALAQKRQTAGEDDRLALMRARLAFLLGQQRSAEARAAATDAAIALHKALGGGWNGSAPQ